VDFVESDHHLEMDQREAEIVLVQDMETEIVLVQDMEAIIPSLETVPRVIIKSTFKRVFDITHRIRKGKIYIPKVENI
jgi:hypothetical protein